jgi:hypothetical protein
MISSKHVGINKRFTECCYISGRGDLLHWPRDTLYPLKLALTSPTSGGRSVGIVRLRTKTTEFFFVCYMTIYGDSIYISDAETFKYMKQEHKSCEGRMKYTSYIYSIYTNLQLYYPSWRYKNTICWVITLCSSETAQYFGGTYHLHLRGWRVRPCLHERTKYIRWNEHTSWQTLLRTPHSCRMQCVVLCLQWSQKKA